jgi:putative polyhydroxyalkanoate system protein
MAELHIERTHGLSPQAALDLAQRWVDQAHKDWGLQCRPGPMDASDPTPQAQRWCFERTGVSGQLHVDAQCFQLELKLGFLLSAYRDRIRAQIESNLDEAIRAIS